MSTLADAIMSSMVARITAEHDPNTIMVKHAMSDMHAQAQEQLNNTRLDTQVRLQKLIKDEENGPNPNTRLIDAWQAQLQSYATILAKQAAAS